MSAAAEPESVLLSVGSRADLRRRLYSLAWPAMLENLLQSTIFMINTALVGRLGAEALSAAGISNFLMFFGLTPVAGLGVGVLAQVARAKGRGNLSEAQRIGWHGLVIGVALSLGTTALVIVFAEPLLRLVGAPATAIEIGAPYLRIASLFAVFQAATMLLGAVLRGTGDTRTPMVAMVLMTAVDGVLGYLLVFDVLGPGGLGIMGVAIAFSAARLVAAGYLALAVWRSPVAGALWQGTRFDRGTARRVLRVGAPAALEQMVSIGGILMASIIGLQLGTVSFAAQSVIGPIVSLPYMPTFGLGLATAAAVGQSLGAGRPDLARRYGIEAVWGGTAVAAAMGLIIAVFPTQLLSIFTSDPAVIEVAELPLRVMGFAVVLYGPGNVLPGALRGAGDTRAVLAIAIVALWVVRLPVALLLGFTAGLGLLGIWLGLAADFVVRSVASYVRFASGKWQGIEV